MWRATDTHFIFNYIMKDVSKFLSRFFVILYANDCRTIWSISWWWILFSTHMLVVYLKFVWNAMSECNFGGIWCCATLFPSVHFVDAEIHDGFSDGVLETFTQAFQKFPNYLRLRLANAFKMIWQNHFSNVVPMIYRCFNRNVLLAFSCTASKYFIQDLIWASIKSNHWSYDDSSRYLAMFLQFPITAFWLKIAASCVAFSLELAFSCTASKYFIQDLIWAFIKSNLWSYDDSSRYLAMFLQFPITAFWLKIAASCVTFSLELMRHCHNVCSGFPIHCINEALIHVSTQFV